MLILGLNAAWHDTAAVLLRDGRVEAAIEEERLNRIKHTNAFPKNAIMFCLKQAAVRLVDIDCIALNFSERSIWQQIDNRVYSQTVPTALSPSAYAIKLFSDAGLEIDPSKVRFVAHHVSHAASASFLSGFDKSLILSLDGIGSDSEIDNASGALFRTRDYAMERLRTFNREESLGFLYGQVTKLLGFREFDEYKVMGLASYGDSSVYRQLFGECRTLDNDGYYSIDRRKLIERLLTIRDAVSKNSSSLQSFKSNIAAACQECLEEIVLHLLKYSVRITDINRLAMAGGVALNCALVAQIHRSGLFKNIFVQPAAHDAGGALGAGLFVAFEEGDLRAKPEQNRSVYWGGRVGSDDEVERILQRWSLFVSWEKRQRIAKCTAERLASGGIIGWVQGRSEFGPRALGNRSILADPRSRDNRDTVNKVVKIREDFRPFAPSVIEEMADRYFEMPKDCEKLPFMLSLVNVRREKIEKLGAVTHVDGTARIQTVNRDVNPLYWQLIHEFGNITGVYAVLNTSFNNSAEPIIESAEDAIVSFLTTGLSNLVIHNFWINKRDVTDAMLLTLVPLIAPSAELGITCTDTGVMAWARYRYESGLGRRDAIEISLDTFSALSRADGSSTLRQLLLSVDRVMAREIVNSVRTLWWHRFIRLLPVAEG